MISLQNMVKLCAGLIGTGDITAWEDDFLLSIFERTENGKETSMLSEKQIGVLERIYAKHFAGDDD